MIRFLSIVLVSLVLSCTPCAIVAPGDCSTEGMGSLTLVSTGLPPGLDGTVEVTGPVTQTFTASGTLSSAAGEYHVSAEPVTRADRFVRTVFWPTISPTRFCLAAGGTQAITVTWAPVATSNALWATHANGPSQFAGFRAEQLATSATVTPQVAAQGALGGDIAFDRAGNVWVPGPTTEDATIVRFPSAAFGSSASVRPDREINVMDLSCSPRIAGLAFDRAGNLYASSPCLNAVLRFDAAQLNSSSTVTPVRTFLVQDPGGIAFDRAGNLWVAAVMDSRVWRFDASQLNGTTASTVPTLKLGGYASSTPGNTALLVPRWLAFDARGDLWAGGFGFYRFRAAELLATGTSDMQPQVRITLAVTALPEGFAFDEEGGLWCAGLAGSIVRLAPAQLDVSSGTGDPTTPETILNSPGLGSVSNLALYPAPAGLPLFHALP